MFSNWVQKWINQIAHVGWGAYLTLVFGLHMRALYAAAIIIGFAAVKEGIFDPLTETKQLQGSGWEDFGFWMAGIGLGIGSLLLPEVLSVLSGLFRLWKL